MDDNFLKRGRTLTGRIEVNRGKLEEISPFSSQVTGNSRIFITVILEQIVAAVGRQREGKI